MYPVDLHMHTVASTHAYSTLHDYIAQAKRKNLQLLAITDHGPDMVDAPHHWHFMNMSVWPRIIEGIAVLRGIEANIRNLQGDIDCTGIMWERLDLIIAGFHEAVFEPRGEAGNTEAMINTIRSGQVHIISHPGNPKYPIDIQAVAEVAAENQVALELNNSSFDHSRKGSLPNCVAIAQAVKQAGGWIALGSDSHIAYTLGEFTHCLSIMQTVGFPEDQVLNTSPRRLLNFLLQRGKPAIPELSEWY